MATPRICSIPDCGKPVFRRCFCAAHYSRLLRHGDPFGGAAPRTSAGNPSEFIEQALQFKSGRCLLWPYYTTCGYGRLVHDGKNIFSHRLVCETVHGLPPSELHEVAHSCGNRLCCNPAHLRWATRSENCKDKLIHGKDCRGEKHHLVKLTIEDVRTIRKLRGKQRLIDLSERYGVTMTQISHIQRKKSWAWLD